MGKEGMRIHAWTSFDDAALEQSVRDCKDLFIFYTEGRQNGSYGEGNAWDAVAGRLAPTIVVTGAACKRRFEVLQERRRDASAALTDGWADAMQAVQDYEQSLLERLHGLTEQMDDRVFRMECALAAICKELGTPYPGKLLKDGE